jgi:hypothetical protein
MSPSEQRRQPSKPGAAPWVTNLAVAGIVVALVAVMVWLAHELTHASDVIDCATRGIRNCG